MIKKLRLKFIVIAMVAVILVLSVIISAINISNYSKVANDADSILNYLKENGGNFQRPEPGSNRNNRDGLGPEVAAETRYFTVKINTDGTIETQTFMVNRISREEAISITNKVLKCNAKNGYSGIYRYLKYTYNNESYISYVDCSRSLNNSNAFLTTSVITSLVGVFLVFAIIFVASRYLFKPVEIAYQKQKMFISNAGHELKTPLTIISANNEIIEMTNGVDESTDAINRQVKRLNQMVNSLSLLTKLYETKKLTNVREINLSSTILDIVEDYRFMIDDSKKLELQIDDNIKYKGELGLIRQLIGIVLDNAIKYSNTYLSLNLYVDNNKPIFEIINDCYEIENGNHPEVFDRFYRNDNIRSQKDGSGIGLSIASEIVELHRAKIEASSINNNFKIKIRF